jgi:16S rRNA (uracil1498-N3)-methyltransferase
MIRLYVRGDLRLGGDVTLDGERTHYLTRVMRKGVGDEIALFNGRHGEWRARIIEASKRTCVLRPFSLDRAQTLGPDLELIIALVKRSRLETIIEKAVELGAGRVRLMITDRTNADHSNVARLNAIAVEAAEQTGRLDAPEVLAPQRLTELLSQWPNERGLMFCDEAGGAPAGEALSGVSGAAWAVIIGPEGGFSPDERAAIRALRTAVPVSLGPRILRADTAAIAALTLWQSSLGDWRGA